ncbi:8-oxo-dGTP pyrophosphatase MutT (NUDIX family) [Sphingomonas insulae]|uniref:NUDIX hydrolase n=1 Tax=Sphingomonas insulae TaxID=424800 RepID=A0ABN1HU84_9SPHN|nr:NUDIX domain-containing protein [Sphingomonas insulae]NIJ28280.1 8-oxo-dGTP pyrophosphatase MutT (NUDIX family) [Sphingomonas insulae]
MLHEPIPAATLVLIRDRADGPPELLMVERAKAMAFAGGAMVFPGGRIDPGDHALAEQVDAGDDVAAKVAAIRETIEEAGVAVGLFPEPSADRLAVIRDHLHDGRPFGAILADEGITLALDQLVPFARWLPDHPNMRIFDTLFFLARAPVQAHATVDATENVRLTWTTAADLLVDADAGLATIIYPTRRNLERLALFASYDEAVAQACGHPVRVITPFTEDRDGVPYLCIPDDLGYPVTAEPMSAAMRG